MAHEIIAPWAEIVPRGGPMTAGVLLACLSSGSSGPQRKRWMSGALAAASQ